MKKLLIISFAALLLSSCQQTNRNNTPSNSNGRYVEFDVAQQKGSSGIESQDIVAMTDKMVRDMLYGGL